MLKCPVCGTENSDLDVVCRSCKGFIQAKVDNLDLFSTIWGLLESPRKYFRRIALARNKNYGLLLSGAFGIALVYAFFWHIQIALRIPSLVTVVGFGVLIGPPAGILVVVLASTIVRMMLQVGGNGLSFRNTFAILAYACAPVVLSLVVLFPLSIGIFGIYFFDNNPSPMVINPLAYIGIIGLGSLATLWSLFLVIAGLRAASGSRWWWSTAAAVVASGVLAYLANLVPVK
jgi:hypothetical protein